MTDIGIQRRQHFRIKYPITEQPEIMLHNIKYAIIDLSESGMRIKADSSILGPKSKVKGSISFKDKTTCDVTGMVLRINEDSIVIKFGLGVPYAKILSEQRRLIQKFGKLET